MQRSQVIFNAFRLLLRLDPVHRAHVDTLIMDYKPHHICPSKCVKEEHTGIDAAALLDFRPL
jgi:hypothetical protein